MSGTPQGRGISPASKTERILAARLVHEKPFRIPWAKSSGLVLLWFPLEIFSSQVFALGCNHFCKEIIKVGGWDPGSFYDLSTLLTNLWLQLLESRCFTPCSRFGTALRVHCTKPCQVSLFFCEVLFPRDSPMGAERCSWDSTHLFYFYFSSLSSSRSPSLAFDSACWGN